MSIHTGNYIRSRTVAFIQLFLSSVGTVSWPTRFRQTGMVENEAWMVAGTRGEGWNVASDVMMSQVGHDYISVHAHRPI